MAESHTENLRHAIRLLLDLPFGKPQDLEATPPQLQIPGAIVLKCSLAAVEEVAVGLDYELPLPPEEVDQARTDANVDLGPRKTMPSTKSQEQFLQVATGAVLGVLVAHRQAEDVGLTGRTAQLASRWGTGKTRGDSPLEIRDRPRGGREGDPIAEDDVRGFEGARTMNPNAGASCPARISGNDHVTRSMSHRQQPP